MLESLERQNLFVIPLDAHRTLVSVPPPVRRRAPRAPARRTARRACPSCIAAPASGTTRPGTPRQRSGTRWPPATSTWPPPRSSSPSRRCCANDAKRSSAAGSTSCPRTSCGTGRCSPSGSSPRSRRATSSTASTQRLETSNSSWPVRSTTRSWSTQAELARLPAAVATYRAALALVGGDLAGTVEQRRPRAGPRRRRRPPHHRLRIRAPRARVLDRRRPGRGTRTPTASPPRASRAPGTSPTSWAAPSPSPTSR